MPNSICVRNLAVVLVLVVVFAVCVLQHSKKVKNDIQTTKVHVYPNKEQWNVTIARCLRCCHLYLSPSYNNITDTTQQSTNHRADSCSCMNHVWVRYANSFISMCTRIKPNIQSSLLVTLWKTTVFYSEVLCCLTGVHANNRDWWTLMNKTTSIHKGQDGTLCNHTSKCSQKYCESHCHLVQRVSMTIVLVCSVLWLIAQDDISIELTCEVCPKMYRKRISIFSGQQNKNFQLSKHERRIYETLYRLRPKGVVDNTLTVYPFSLNQYVEDIVKRDMSGTDLMRYEWARFLSFTTFPQTSAASPLRLSQAGFYHTGNGEQVKCFCCGLTHDQWSSHETALEVHQRLSPGCRFINGEDTDNVTIHNSEYYTTDFQSRVDSRPVRRSCVESGASGGPSDRLNQTSQSSDTTVNAHCVNNTITATNNSEATERSSTTAQTNTASHENTRAEASTNSSQAKYPHYATLDTRLSSFSTWNLHDIQDPRELAEAGFFYTGVRDFVRCFECGVGLKNWERGDNPWGEHRHWKAMCPFLLQNGTPVTSQTNEVSREEVKQTTLSTGNARSSPSPTPTQSAATARASCTPRETSQPNNGATSKTVDAEEHKMTETSTAEAETKEDKKVENGTGDPGRSAERQSLIDENRNLRTQMTCKICMDQDSNVVFLPCGHMVACRTCAQSLKKCPLCRKLIKGSVHVYQS